MESWRECKLDESLRSCFIHPCECTKLQESLLENKVLLTVFFFPLIVLSLPVLSSEHNAKEEAAGRNGWHSRDNACPPPLPHSESHITISAIALSALSTNDSFLLALRFLTFFYQSKNQRFLNCSSL